MIRARHPARVATRERPVDRGLVRGRRLIVEGGHGLRVTRQDRGLSLLEVGRAAGLSASAVSRIERGLVPSVSVIALARLHAVIGLDLTMRAYPGGQPVRDAAHAALLADLRATLHRDLRWSIEVPLPLPGDQRAWDALISGARSAADRRAGRDAGRDAGGGEPSWRYGVEAEMSPRDGQALLRRLHLKERDGDVDGVILLLRPTQQARAFVRESSDAVRAAFPCAGPRALELLRAGVEPEGSAVIVLPPKRR